MSGRGLTRAKRILGAAAIGFIPSIAVGATTAPMMIETTIVPSCDIRFEGAGESASLDFGTVSESSGEIRVQTPSSGGAALTIACTASGAAPRIAIGAGDHAFGTARFMVNGRVRVAYDLFRDPAFTSPWQPGVAYALTSPTAAQPRVVTIYGRVPHPEQATMPGTYTDVTLITLDY